MVKNIVVLGGNSHPELVDRICASLGLSPCRRILTKFSGGETRCEVQDSVRGKDVYIIQTGAGKVNDVLMDLLIMVSALKTGGNLCGKAPSWTVVCADSPLQGLRGE
jgi:ribose-phosphate pyrophosphokinase